MSAPARIALVLAAVAVLVVGFVLLSPGDDDDRQTAGTQTTAPPATATPEGETPSTASEFQPPADHERVATATIRVRDGEPVGGVRTIEVRKGERVRIHVRSTDTSDEVHLHGYDVRRELRAGGSVQLSVEADAEGIFEIELEGSHTQIGRLVVEP